MIGDVVSIITSIHSSRHVLNKQNHWEDHSAASGVFCDLPCTIT